MWEPFEMSTALSGFRPDDLEESGTEESDEVRDVTCSSVFLSYHDHKVQVATTCSAASVSERFVRALRSVQVRCANDS
ncbi:hypothetical protein TNCV_2529591 [Trichonephila clavipes]|nr:hypothetical protein TNCV_2529591 [Trichonephila clavipes]